jgi:ATP-dependent DNA helicase RecQ
MSKDVLAQLDLTFAQVRGLPGNGRSRLLNFLLRWEYIDTLHACLDILAPDNPSLVSLLDLRAKALLIQGRADDAAEAMEERLIIKTSPTARSLLARIHLARGDVTAAREIAQSLVEEHADSALAWGLLGQVELSREDLDASLSAYCRLGEIRSHSRSYLLGMLSLYQAQEDWVTASGYAVQALNTSTDEAPLPVTYLRRLRDYFRASGEVTRAIEAATGIERRYADELADLKEALSPGCRPPTRTGDTRDRTAAKGHQVPLPEPQTASSLPSLEHVPVSEEERLRVQQAAQQLFGFETLLPGQLQAIACVLRKEDVLTILPTGGGKSLCYQIPAMLDKRGTTLIISPLIALMKDQVDSLPAKLRRRATTINSSLDGVELYRRQRQASQGNYRLVYAAPERLRQPPFLHALRRAGLNRLVIDEAHCVSVWGHDFRPDYLTLAQARQHLGDPPLLALTATAPPRVRQDILQHLGDMRVIAGDVTRPNLQLEVLHARNTDEKLRYLVSFCRSEPGSGIVYAGTRARCEELAALLRRHGINAEHYHAGIADRAEAQDRFMGDQVRVVVATIAFGMGIDKPDIRFIIHFVPPQSLEAYYQEAGRAGRDGQPSRCLLMYAPSDRGTLTRRARRDRLPVKFLRTVYVAVKRRLGTNACGRVAVEDLEHDLQADDTRIRVALSLLEEAGLLRRGPDLPRAAVVCLKPQHVPTDAQQLQSFCQAARLRPGQSLTLDLAAIARKASLPLQSIERQVLDWHSKGWLDYRPAGRDLLLEILPKPQDSSERIAALLDRYDAIQAQRVDEITAYARTHRCRHGHLNAYLGGRNIERCNACDNCVEIPRPADADLPGEREQLLTILRCVSNAPWSWGRMTLLRILHGDIKTPRNAYPLHEKARAQAEFGALAFRSRGAIEQLVDRLEGNGFLSKRRLDNDGVVLDLTSEGKSALHNPGTLNDLLVPASKPPPPRSASKGREPDPDIDDALFQRFRAWRLEKARTQGVPPFVVFHDRHLRAIAAHCPTTLEALSQLKGIGPNRLEKYGREILELVQEHLGHTESPARN